MLPRAWKINVALLLIGSTVLIGLVHIVVFRDPRTLLFYLFLDVVFVPVQVLLVTIVIEQLLTTRERQEKLRKLNIVISAFMGDVGAGLLRRVDAFCGEAPELAASLAVNDGWKEHEYLSALNFAENYHIHLSPTPEQLFELRNYLLGKRSFILSLLQNPHLLEHENFTDLLWSVCHLTEELEARDDFARLPINDLKHLDGDIRRANSRLIREWLRYMQHLQRDYPYIFSLSVRTNPFRPDANAIVP